MLLNWYNFAGDKDRFIAIWVVYCISYDIYNNLLYSKGIHHYEWVIVFETFKLEIDIFYCSLGL